ncbi:MAG: sugar kinase [Bacteroidota bacterium]|nr:sugar kinase [Bacteroidota bacterium]MDP4233336.1 sugar kinase [Bacteroidota bacterium]MDP4244190.1 sugar kinase [Bacteroidota bacterium]MDP4286959.1 sugar kinase [Bacteroidota bacterium]
METNLDLIGIGECLAELNSVDEESGRGMYQLGYSGDVLNSLSAAKALGLTTGLISALGDDPFTDGLVEVLQSEDIDLSHAPILEGKANGAYFIHRDEGGNPHFHFLRRDSAATYAFSAQPLEDLIRYASSARAVLFSSIPVAVMKDRNRLIELVRETHGHAKVCFDLNVRPSLWDNLDALRELLPVFAPHVDVLFVSAQDDALLFNHREAAAAVDHYCNMGFTEVAFCRGAQSTLVGLRNPAKMDSTIFEVPVPRVTSVVDATGAGDAFNAGYIAAMLRGHPPFECAAMGNATAACSLEVRGGRSTGITIQRVERHYRPLVKWGTFKGPALAMSRRAN